MYTYLNALFAGCLIISNVIGVKLFHIGPFILPGAVLVYMLTFLITDVIGEVYGKKAASHTVRAGFFTQLIALVFLFIVIKLPPAPVFDMQKEFSMILGGSFRVVLASLLSYMVSQNIDVLIFHRLKARHGTAKLWIRNNVSTMTSQLFDTTIFIMVAFWGLVPFSVILGMIATQYVVKFMIAALDTPLAYLLVKRARRTQNRTTVMEPEV